MNAKSQHTLEAEAGTTLIQWMVRQSNVKFKMDSVEWLPSPACKRVIPNTCPRPWVSGDEREPLQYLIFLKHFLFFFMLFLFFVMTGPKMIYHK